MAALDTGRRFTLTEELDRVTAAQTRAHEAWKAMRDAEAAWERAQVEADVRMGSLLMEVDVALMGGTNGA